MGNGRDASFPDRINFFQDGEVSCEGRGGELVAGELGISFGTCGRS